MNTLNPIDRKRKFFKLLGIGLIGLPLLSKTAFADIFFRDNAGNTTNISSGFIPRPTASNTNTANLTADTTLDSSAKIYQKLTPNASTWTLTLPATLPNGYMLITNASATNSFTIEGAAEGDITLLAGQSREFINL